jgi:hypothetical protein
MQHLQDHMLQEFMKGNQSELQMYHLEFSVVAEHSVNQAIRYTSSEATTLHQQIYGKPQNSTYKTTFNTQDGYQLSPT